MRLRVGRRCRDKVFAAFQLVVIVLPCRFVAHSNGSTKHSDGAAVSCNSGGTPFPFHVTTRAWREEKILAALIRRRPSRVRQKEIDDLCAVMNNGAGRAHA